MAGHAWSAAHPAIRDILAGVACQRGTPARRTVAIGTAEIRKLVVTCDASLVGQRDRAPLLDFAAALRRSELVGVQREHLTATPEACAC